MLFWKSFRASWRKSANLKRISQMLGGGGYPTDAKSLFQIASTHEVAEKELFDLIEADPALAAIMVHFGADRENLQKAYRALVVCGAGQWARGHWVAASALAFGATLQYVLASTRNAQDSSQDIWLPVAIRLLDYFEKGEILPILSPLNSN